MFLAIINDTYSDVKSHTQPEDDGPLALFIKNKLNKIFRRKESNASWISEEMSNEDNEEIKLLKIQNEKGEPDSFVNCPGCKVNTEKLER